jgi:hypothetical protein
MRVIYSNKLIDDEHMRTTRKGLDQLMNVYICAIPTVVIFHRLTLAENESSCIRRRHSLMELAKGTDNEEQLE